MEDPTVPEMIRELQRDVREMRAEQTLYVTREVMELKLEAVAKDQVEVRKDQAEDRAKLERFSNLAWTAVIGPVIVGVILFFVLGKT